VNSITTNCNIKIFLVKHKLIREVSPEDNLKSEYLTYRYYSIGVKGQEYLKRYEGFKELIS
jgi:predicted transcriptional regulator